jgi:hypothetical protein
MMANGGRRKNETIKEGKIRGSDSNSINCREEK